ncbi:MAG: DUF1080 domain-containing protein [Bacteroidales bacterium]|nr:DUF1080 domain-containing protein [Bacteroidales bacterium]
MKKPILLLCAFGLLSLISCKQDGGWVDLFNGSDLEGWEVKGAPESNFFVEDGILVAETKMGLPNTFLATTKNFANFELEVEFKVDIGMNSGVQIRSGVYEEPTTTPYLNGRLEEGTRDWEVGKVNGYQIEIDPSDRAWTGGFYEEGGRGWLVPLNENEQARKAFKQGEWNHFRIIADGNHFQTWINGVLAVETTDDKASNGFIALQLHSINNEDQLCLRVLWKNIRIHELD